LFKSGIRVAGKLGLGFFACRAWSHYFLLLNALKVVQKLLLLSE